MGGQSVAYENEDKLIDLQAQILNDLRSRRLLKVFEAMRVEIERRQKNPKDSCEQMIDVMAHTADPFIVSLIGGEEKRAAKASRSCCF